jgi:hypothetical protein
LHCKPPTAFINHSIHQEFLNFGEKAKSKNIFVGRYVLMPDHLHLFVSFSEDFGGQRPPLQPMRADPALAGRPTIANCATARRRFASFRNEA